MCIRDRFINTRRIAWLETNNEGGTTQNSRKILEWRPAGRTSRGRPTKRRIEDDEEDLRIVGIRRWRGDYAMKGLNEKESLKTLESMLGCNATRRS